MNASGDSAPLAFNRASFQTVRQEMATQAIAGAMTAFHKDASWRDADE
jgi:hypothetical protein